MKRKLIASLLLLSILSGCVPSSIVDDILIIEGEGYDYIGHGKIIGTVTMPNFVQGGEPGSQGAGLPTTGSMIRSLSGVTYDGKSLADHFQPEGQKILRAGKIRLMLFNERLAKHGVAKDIAFRNRDPDPPLDITIAVVKGSCKQLLTATDYQTQIPISRYVQDLIMQNSQQNLPDVNLVTFINSYYGSYMDPFMPLIEKQGDHIKLDGLALFRHDKYVLSLGNNQTFVFKMLYQPFNQGVYDYQIKPGKHVALRNVKTSVSYSAKDGNSASPDITAHVKVVAQVRQASPNTVSKQTAPIVSQAFSKHMAKEARRLVSRLQKKRIDPLQLTNYIRSFTHHFNGSDWRERYAHVRFHCKVNVLITQTGISH
ncbi:MAG: Ger(x)C family spore germination protein [Sporolactobacillus sp.]